MRKIMAVLVAGLLLPSAARAARLTFYLSPSGQDDFNGLSETSPMRSFERAFSVMQAGDELVLLDGVYGESSGTGYLSYAGLHSAQPPSGRPELPTLIRAKHPGAVQVVGGLFLGRSFRGDSDITIQGLTFEGLADGTGGGAATVFNASRVTLKDCGFHTVQPMADAIVSLGQGRGNRLEDVWVWGRAPAAISVSETGGFSARRVLVRLDSGRQALAARGSSLSLDDVLSLEGDGARWISASASTEPWPDEQQIRKDLCVDSGVSRGFCAWDSLSRYLRDIRPLPPARPQLARPMPFLR